jgi:hypothetical protein
MIFLPLLLVLEVFPGIELNWLGHTKEVVLWNNLQEVSKSQAQETAGSGAGNSAVAQAQQVGRVADVRPAACLGYM